jgi:hypothetical protein
VAFRYQYLALTGPLKTMEAASIVGI